MSQSDIIQMIINVIGSNLRSEEGLRAGVEIENIIYDSSFQRIPVNRGEIISTMDIKDRLESHNGIAHTLSIEPGGQLEYASPPCADLHTIHKEWTVYLADLISVCDEENLMLPDFALEPIYSPNDITIIDHKKYRLMWDRFSTTGSLGHWMMLNTTSVQVNYDFVSLESAGDLALLADCLHPFVSVIFANAPFRDGAPTGNLNMREIIWNDTDPIRCGTLLDQDIETSDNLVEKYVQYVLTTPTIFTITKAGEVEPFNGTLAQWLTSLQDKQALDMSDTLVALHHIFTQVRFKTVLEVRGSDRPPFGYEMAPVAFLTGLLRVPEVMSHVCEIVSTWTPEERHQVNRKAKTLDLSQEAFEGKSLHTWIDRFFELSLEGLSKRADNSSVSDERIFLEPFAENFLSHGPMSIQIQKEFQNSGKSLKTFVKDRWHRQRERLSAVVENERMDVSRQTTTT